MSTTQTQSSNKTTTHNGYYDIFLETKIDGYEGGTVARVKADGEEEASYLAILHESCGIEYAFVKKSIKEDGRVTDHTGTDISVSQIVPLQDVQVEVEMDSKTKQHTISMPTTENYPRYIMERYIS